MLLFTFQTGSTRMALTSIIAVVLAVAINGGNAKGECAIHAFLIDWEIKRTIQKVSINKTFIHFQRCQRCHFVRVLTRPIHLQAVSCSTMSIATEAKDTWRWTTWTTQRVKPISITSMVSTLSLLGSGKVAHWQYSKVFETCIFQWMHDKTVKTVLYCLV